MSGGWKENCHKKKVCIKAIEKVAKNYNLIKASWLDAISFIDVENMNSVRKEARMEDMDYLKHSHKH